MDPKRLSTIAAALASETRAGIVSALMSGTAHTGRELARHVGLAPSTTSEHLGLLLDAGLVAVEAQGRHRYFRLAGADVAAFLEATVALDAAIDPVPPARRIEPGLAFARSCYDHLAGELGVLVYERLVDLGAIRAELDSISLASTGFDLCDRLHIDVPKASKRPVVRACLDWTQRRHHLAGVVGARLLATMLDQGWVRRSPGRPRELRLTGSGRTAITTHFGVEIT